MSVCVCACVCMLCMGVYARMSAYVCVCGCITSRVIPKTQKMVLDASLLNTLHYEVWIKGKLIKPSKEVASSPTLWCCSY